MIRLEDIGGQEWIVNLSESGTRAVVKRTGERAANVTGDEDFRHVSSHNLRYRFAQRLLANAAKSSFGNASWRMGFLPSDRAVLNAPPTEVVDEAFEEVEFI